eukprot:GFKZ01003742.1.p1 GENE.GFKZ01003742.1~~GFKZ01003742.1.p1  ORF type:complete len:343 (+),score=52.70 GFKZ01003742.1:156-1031(+)
MSTKGVSYYAQRILQSPDPLEKVRLTGEAVQHWHSHRTPGPILLPPASPARPALPKIVSTSEMPGVKEVDVPSNVYHIHGLAHVELNAIDLCMDTMLRFGDGVWGEEWVTDWISVASDEARHFRWLHERLESLGSFYGALPAHGVVWKGAEASKVGRKERLVMGQLVAEARGLDAGPRLMKRLLGFGDKKSADVVAVIAEEEVEHVRIGVKWFLSECEREGLDGGDEFRRIALQMSNPGAFIPPFEVERRRVAGLLPEWYLPVAEEMARVRRERREEQKRKEARIGTGQLA